MPVPDRSPPSCRGLPAPGTQGPPTTSSSTVTPSLLPSYLPDLQADSAMEDETDGFSFATMDLPSASPGEMAGIFPADPFTTGATMRTPASGIYSSAFSTSDQVAFQRYPRAPVPMHEFGLTSQLNRLAITEDRIGSDSGLDTENLISRGRSRRTDQAQRWLRDSHVSAIVEPPPLPTSIRDPPPSIRSPPENPADEDLDTSDKSDQYSSSAGYALWFDVDSDGDTPLFLAIIHKVTEQALRMIRSVPSVDLLDHRNLLQQSALHLAVLTHQPQVVRALVVTGASLDIRDRYGNTPLHLCCKQGDLDSMSALTTPLSENERCHLPSSSMSRQIQDMSILNYDGESCLHVAAKFGHLSVTEFLLTKKHLQCNPNIADGKSGRTILHYAVESRDVPLILFLISRSDVKIDNRTFDGTTALSLAVGRSYNEVANLLIAAGANSELVHLSDSESDCDCAFMEQEYSQGL